MTALTVEQAARIAATQWADPLTPMQRAELAKLLARACGRSWRAAESRRLGRATALVVLSVEMSDLHKDVTERAATPERRADQ